MMSLLLAFFFLSIVFSFLCSLWEAVLLSITPTYARIQQQEGKVTGRYLQEFKENIDRPLAAILTLNTIAHTVGAIGVGEQAAKIWADSNPLITRLLVPAGMTLAVLILSEIVPKTIGALYWKRLVPFTVYSLRFLLFVLAPLVWMGQLVTKSLKSDVDTPILTRNDFLAMAELGAEEGVFEDGESAMIGSMIRFKAVQARDVMTPRTVVSASAEELSIAEYFADLTEHSFSRIPVYSEGNKDQITGYFIKVDLMQAIVEGKGEQALASLRRDIVAVDETYPITELFQTLMQRKEHIAVVVDEFGGMDGIVTMEDIIETLLGMEIMDETDTTTDMRILAQRHKERRAKVMGVLETE
ncbi:MAG: hemolysin family protein [Pseudomonadota bacterium]